MDNPTITTRTLNSAGREVEEQEEWSADVSNIALPVLNKIPTSIRKIMEDDIKLYTVRLPGAKKFVLVSHNAIEPFYPCDDFWLAAYP